MSNARKMTWLIVLLAVLSPLGLSAEGTAYGEWGASELKKIVGYAPRGMVRLETFWRWSPLPDYSVQGWQGELMGVIAYILSAAIGVAAIFAVFKGAEFLLKTLGGTGGEGADRQ